MSRKKRKVDKVELSHGEHPYGIRPLGNYLMDILGGNRVVLCRNPGLGNFARLPDDAVVEVMYWLTARELCALAPASKAMHAFANFDDAWRNLLFEESHGAFTFRLSWKHTYRCWLQKRESPFVSPLKIEGFYSDFLFRPWFAATAAIESHWVEKDTIPRRSNLSKEEFINEYEIPNKPVIITDVVTKWPAFQKWSKDYLQSHYGDVVFEAGALRMKLSDYFAYSDGVRESERPLYLFDKHFVKKCPEMGKDFSVPTYFDDDLFSVLGNERPDYRWLIVGAPRSGSSFHIDPNCTSAWNAVISGRKKWILFPPNQTPPGVAISQDGSEVRSPISITEWFCDFYKHAYEGEMKPKEGICNEGEIIFVPHGWWHCVLNLEPEGGEEEEEEEDEDGEENENEAAEGGKEGEQHKKKRENKQHEHHRYSIAITQNFVNFQNLPNVLHFLKTNPDDVSGMGGRDCQRTQLYERFVDALREKYPDRLSKALIAAQQVAVREEERQAETKMGHTQRKKSSAWEALVVHEETSGFTFNFNIPEENGVE